MDEILLQKLLDLIRDGKQHAFYTWAVWRKTKSEVLRLDHYECQKCKARKKYSHAVVVHHVNHLREHPELALNIWYDDKETGEKKRQLISLCKACHEEEHPERMKKPKSNAKEKFWTEERW